MASILELTKGLKAAFETKNYDSCLKLLVPIKIELIKAGLLIPDVKRLSENEDYSQDLNIAKKILEIGALSCIYTNDSSSFTSYYNQLRAFYFSNCESLAESENKSKLIGLYLLILLAQNDYTKFHSEVEYLNRYVGSLEGELYPSYPIKLERLIMEGSYQKAWDLLESGSKVEEFNVFSETLKYAIRDEIALNSEHSYTSLPLFNAKALLFFDNEKELETFATERGWAINQGTIIFHDELVANTEPSESIVDMAFGYAINLESIV